MFKGIIFILFFFFFPFFVLAASPQILLLDTQTPGPFYQGQTITFKYQICDPDNDVVEAFLAYGDGKADAVNFLNCQTLTQNHIFQTNGIFPVTLRVRDSAGAQTTKTKDVIVLVNIPPQINRFSLGSKSVFAPGGIVFFEISACAPEKDDAVAGFIDFGDGTSQSFSPLCNLTNPTIIAHQYFGPGNYPVKLIVQDSRGLKSEKNLEISIKATPISNINFPPEIRRFSTSSKSQFTSGGMTYFEIVACDPNKNDLIAANLDFGDGTSQSFTPSCDSSNPTIIPHQYFASKIYSAKLIVQDSQGLKTEKNLDILIKPASFVEPNFPPEIKRFSLSSRSQLYPKGMTYFEIVACDPNKNDLIAANLDFGDGTSQSFTPNCLNSNPNIINHQYTLPGIYKAILTVQDQFGLQTQKTLSVLINIPGNREPKANFSFSPSSPTAQSVVYFVDKSIDDDGVSSINFWQWDFGDGFTSNAQHPTHTYAKSGSYKVSLTVKDSGNLTSKLTKTINIKEVPNKAPTAIFSFLPQSPQVGQTIYFTDRSYDNDKENGGYIKSWLWDFGDGTSSNLQHPTKQYQKGGNFKVRLTVTDNGGLKATFAQDIFIHSSSVITQMGQSGQFNKSQDKNYQIKDGDVVKTASSDKIWRIIRDKRHWIINEEILNLYGFSLEDVKIVSLTQLAKFKRAYLLKDISTNKIYYLHEDGRKRHLKSPKVFLSYRNRWQDVISVLPEEIESYPDVIYIKTPGISKIFLLDNGYKRPLNNPDQRARSEAVFVNKIEFESYPNGPPID